MENKWYIYSLEHGGFWRPGRRGYTPDRAEAGQYGFREALQIVADANQFVTADVPKETMCPVWPINGTMPA